MAMDLLEDIVQHNNNMRLYRYDAESFAWVMLWITTRYEHGALLDPELLPFQDWTTTTFKDCLGAKGTFPLESVKPTGPYADYWPAVWDLVSFWRERRTKRQGLRPAKRVEPENNEIARSIVQLMREIALEYPHLVINVPDRAPFSSAPKRSDVHSTAAAQSS
jgi:hypothetical protein